MSEDTLITDGCAAGGALYMGMGQRQGLVEGQGKGIGCGQWVTVTVTNSAPC